MKVRGAPAIGITAAYGLYLAFQRLEDISSEGFLDILNEKIDYLNSARPTAVNLQWALESVKTELEGNWDFDAKTIKNTLLDIATKIHEDDHRRCESISEYGQKVLNEQSHILTHCNTGALATGGIGTALGIIYKAHITGKEIDVFATESRPVLQGARLTVWELMNSKIPVTLICDSASAWLMKQQKVDVVIVGADRVAADGSTANKIGTYNLALLANYHNVPFYIAAPLSTFDFSLTNGNDIPIEYRGSNEIRNIYNKYPITLPDVNCWNPAFDITPSDLISGIITEKGIVCPPYDLNIKKMLTNRVSIF